eukprot:COSAG01_NODE_69801_length_260_cov_0.813665_1_plen_24_part_01
MSMDWAHTMTMNTTLQALLCKCRS